MGLRECYVNGVGVCYFHGFGTHVSGDTRAIIEAKEQGNVMMVYPEEIHFKLPPSVLEKIRQKEIEEINNRKMIK